uniref:Uncharacterized protein n=1 Tax=Strongyloides stercoralis TaxID=6248 RepID=A0A0K0E6C6_STRER
MKYLTIFFLTIIIFNILLTSYEKPAKKSLKKNRDNSVLQKKTKKNNVKKNKKKSKKRKNKKINSFRTIRPEPLYRRIINCLSSTL